MRTESMISMEEYLSDKKQTDQRDLDLIKF